MGEVTSTTICSFVKFVATSVVTNWFVVAVGCAAGAKGLYLFGHCDNEKFMLDIRPAKLHRVFETTKVGIIIIPITVSI